jgi:hypothetical protein
MEIYIDSCEHGTLRTTVLKHTLLVLALELLNEVVNETVFEVLATQVSVTGDGLDLEDTLFQWSRGRLIEISSTKIVSDSGSGGLVDDAKDDHSHNGTCVIGSLPLGVIEVASKDSSLSADLVRICIRFFGACESCQPFDGHS